MEKEEKIVRRDELIKKITELLMKANIQQLWDIWNISKNYITF